MRDTKALIERLAEAIRISEGHHIAGVTIGIDDAWIILSRLRLLSPQHPEGTVEAVARAIYGYRHEDPFEDATEPMQAEYRGMADEALSAMPGVPDGWKLVPNMPDKDMLDAYMNALEAPLPDGDKRYPYYRQKAIKRYCAMLSAAPLPPEDKP